MGDLFAKSGNGKFANDYPAAYKWESLGLLKATYLYRDADGNVVLEVLRSTDKEFSQRVPDKSKRSGYAYKLPKGFKAPLYGLPEVLHAIAGDERVFVVEGEKDVATLRAWGFVATCNPMGAGKWRKHHADVLKNTEVVVLPDNDDTGKAHAWKVTKSVPGAVYCEIPDAKPKGDVTDYKATGGTSESFMEIVEAAIANPPEPSAETQPSESKADTVDSKPMPMARHLLDSKFRNDDGELLLRRHRGETFQFDGGVYSRIADEALCAEVYRHLETLSVIDSDGNTKPISPTAKMVSEVTKALPACGTLLCDHDEAPFWIDGRPEPDPKELVICRNGLLDMGEFKLHSATPDLFSVNAIGACFDPDAPHPEVFLGFLDELFPSDPQSIAAIREWFGYTLTPDTSQQKALLIVGPKRSGKGTLARVQSALVGKANSVSPTLSSLAMRFGLQPLIGRYLAVVSDARLGARSDQAQIAERILSITGEDDLTIDRKHIAAWTGKLLTRFMLLTNELPRLQDTSGAFASRFIVLNLTESFFGREDTTLTDRILEELPGILNWAIAGWDSLRERGRFVQPESAMEAVEELENLSSPVAAFVSECCDIKADATIETHELFKAWQEWCGRNGRTHPGNSATFGRDLRAAVAPAKRAQRRGLGGTRLRVYAGIRLKQDFGTSGTGV